MLFLSKGLKAFLVIVFILVVAIEWVIPFAVIKGIQNWYEKQGSDYSVDVESLEINPWISEIILKNVKLSYSDSTMNLDLLEFNLDVVGLFNHQIHIEKILLSGSQIDIHKKKRSITVLGVSLPMDDDALNASKSSDKKDTKPWVFTLSEAEIKKARFIIDDEKIHADVVINEITINENGHNQGLLVSGNITLNAIELSDKSVGLNKPSQLSFSGKINGLNNNPKWEGHINLSELNANVLNNELMIGSISLNGMQVNSEKQMFDAIELSKLNINKGVVRLNKYAINKFEINSNIISSQDHIFDGLEIKIEIDKKGNPILFSNEKGAFEDDAIITENNENTAQIFWIQISKISQLNEQESNIVFINNNLTPKVNIKSKIKEFVIGNITNKSAYTNLYANISFDDYSELKLTSTFNIQDKNSESNLKLSQYNLLDLNGYIEKMLGYHVNQGLLDVDLNLDIKSNILSGEADIVVINSKMEPSNEATIDRISKKISMPIDTALSLLKDDKNNIKLNIPIKGDIQDPDFGLNDLVSILSKKALKSAASSYLLQAFFPYTLVIDIVDIAGINPFTIRLEPIALVSDQITKEQEVYINKIVKILQQKEDLQLYVCPYIKKTPDLDDNWQAIGLNMASIVKRKIVDADSDLSKRIVLCQAKLSDKSEIQLGF